MKSKTTVLLGLVESSVPDSDVALLVYAGGPKL